jgi:hypothetical protein
MTNVESMMLDILWESTDGKGRATDNICIERFWRSAKCERIYLNEYSSINALQKDVDDYSYLCKGLTL